MNTKIKKFFWKNSVVGTRVRLTFLWTLVLTGSILLAGLAPLPNVLATVALCVAMVVITAVFGSWVKKDMGYFHHKWRSFPLPACRDRARHYVVPAVIIGILIVVPTLWIAADAKWGEGFHEVIRGLGYTALGLIAMAIVTGLIWASITARRTKVARAKMDSWNEIQQIKNGYETELAQAAKRETSLKDLIQKERSEVKEAFSGDFLRLVAELTLERQSGKKPDKFRAEVRRLLEDSLRSVYGRKTTEDIIAKAVMKILREAEREKNPPAPETPNQPVDGNAN